MRREEIVGGLHPEYHPSVWKPTTVAPFDSEHDLWGVLFGSYERPLLRIYRQEWEARMQAQSLDMWRQTGNRAPLRHNLFVPYYQCLVHSSQTRKRRLRGEPLSLAQYVSRRHLVLHSPADVCVQLAPVMQAIAAGEFLHTVEQSKAEQLGKYKFGGDVTLDLAKCVQWSSLTMPQRLALLNRRQLAELRLFEALPKIRTTPKELQYHDSAPDYKTLRPS